MGFSLQVINLPLQVYRSGVRLMQTFKMGRLFVTASTDMVDDLTASEHEEGFPVVLQTETLKHRFNFSGAISKAVKATNVGGACHLFTPANNSFDYCLNQFILKLLHGFLSPAIGCKTPETLATLEERDFVGKGSETVRNQEGSIQRGTFLFTLNEWIKHILRDIVACISA